MSVLKNIPRLRFPEFNDGWTKTTLQNVCEVNPRSNDLPNRFVYIDLESVENGRLLFQNEITKDVSPSRAQRLLEKGDIIYQTVRPYQKNNYLFNLDGDFVASTGYAQLRSNQNYSFLYQLLHTEKFVNKVLLRSTGSNYPAINSTDLKKIIFNIPSLPEQQKIADFLTTVDKRIELLEKKKTLLETYKKGVMKKIFNQEIRFKDDNGNDFPDWEEKRLEDVLNYEQPTKYLVDSTEYSDSYNLPVLTAGKTFILGYTNETIGIYSKLPTIIFDDFTTSFHYVDFEFKVKSSAMKMLTVTSDDYNLKFIFESMKTLRFVLSEHKRYWISEYSKLFITIPSIEEQIKISNLSNQLDKQMELLQTQIDKSKTWKKGLLQKMFV